MSLGRTGYGTTDVGKKRLSNEDAFLFDDALGLYVVADGMGGHAAGEVASQEAVDSVHGMVQKERALLHAIEAGDGNPDSLRRLMRVLESAVQAATYMVFAIAQHDPEQQGMGTTVSALLLCGPYAVTAQVGDSRVYLVRHGIASQLTEDHTLVAWQLKQGIITEEEAQNSPHRNVITRAVGSREYVQVDTHFFSTQPGDNFVICSDGLHTYVGEDEIASAAQEDLAVAARGLIGLANDRGGRDNITVIVARRS